MKRFDQAAAHIGMTRATALTALKKVPFSNVQNHLPAKKILKVIENNFVSNA